MKKETLFVAIGGIDPAYVEEFADVPSMRARHARRGRVLLAAVFALLVAACAALPALVPRETASSPVMLDLSALSVEELAALPDRSKRVPTGTPVTWGEAEIFSYYQKEFTPAYLPTGLLPSVLNGSAVVYLGEDGTPTEDALSLLFYHAYYPDGSPKLTEGVAAPRGFTLSVSKLGFPPSCGLLPLDSSKRSELFGVPVSIGHVRMPYGPYDSETHAPAGEFDLYLAEFELDGISYQLTSEQLELSEVVKIVASLIHGDANFILS